ncbi:MAG: hypothetical protein IJY69_03580 [Clostridia bacterium]|nr:hypothetical protein [Clostridia bacterium]
MSDKKKKKQKTVYIDDGRTLADMSGVSRTTFFGEMRKRQSEKAESQREPRIKGATPFRTYMNAVRLMIVPMLVTLGIIAAAFLLIYLML